MTALSAVASFGMLAPDAAVALGVGGGSHGSVVAVPASAASLLVAADSAEGSAASSRVAVTAAFTTWGHDPVWAQLGGSGFLCRIIAIIPMPGMTMAIMAFAIS